MAYPAILSVMITWPLALALFIGALLLHLEIARGDMNAPRPPDPFRQERLRGGESLNPDDEVAPNPRFPKRR
jgi:predicted lipid-binding transport protein (Tim44 family)